MDDFEFDFQDNGYDIHLKVDGETAEVYYRRTPPHRPISKSPYLPGLFASVFGEWSLAGRIPWAHVISPSSATPFTPPRKAYALLHLIKEHRPRMLVLWDAYLMGRQVEPDR